MSFQKSNLSKFFVVAASLIIVSGLKLAASILCLSCWQFLSQYWCLLFKNLKVKVGNGLAIMLIISLIVGLAWCWICRETVGYDLKVCQNIPRNYQS